MFREVFVVRPEVTGKHWVRTVQRRDSVVDEIGRTGGTTRTLLGQDGLTSRKHGRRGTRPPEKGTVGNPREDGGSLRVSVQWKSRSGRDCRGGDPRGKIHSGDHID